MKKLFLMLCILAVAVPCFAAVGILEDGTYVGATTDINIKNTGGGHFDGSLYTLDIGKPVTIATGSVALTAGSAATTWDDSKTGLFYLATSGTTSAFTTTSNVKSGKQTYLEIVSTGTNTVTFSGASAFKNISDMTLGNGKTVVAEFVSDGARIIGQGTVQF